MRFQTQIILEEAREAGGFNWKLTGRGLRLDISARVYTRSLAMGIQGAIPKIFLEQRSCEMKKVTCLDVIFLPSSFSLNGSAIPAYGGDEVWMR